MYADIVQENEPRRLWHDPWVAGSKLCTRCGLSICETSMPTLTVTHFFQQVYPNSKKAVPPNRAIPYGPIIHIGAIPIQTTIVVDMRIILSIKSPREQIIVFMW